MEDEKTCPKCLRSFLTYSFRNRHISQCGGDVLHQCNDCSKTFSRRFNLLRHKENIHGGKTRLAFACGVCNLVFERRKMVLTHRRLAHENKVTAFEVKEHAHNLARQVLRQRIPERIKTVEEAFLFSYKSVTLELKRHLSLCKVFKYALILHVEMIKLDADGVSADESEVFPFRSTYKQISHSTHVKPTVYEHFAFIRESILEFLHRGSGWILSDILMMDMEVAKCRVLAGGSGCGLHQLSFKRQAALDLSRGFSKSVRKRDKTADCFYLAVASHFFKSEATDVQLRKFVKDKFANVKSSTAMRVDQIRWFEKANSELDISISVLFVDEDENFVPLKAGCNIRAANQIVLLLFYTRGKKKASAHDMHYVRIANPEQFFSSHNGQTKSYRRKNYVCFHCFNSFVRKQAYETHISWCHDNVGQRLVYPGEGETISFEHRMKEYKLAYTVFFDFETLQCEPDAPCTCSKETLEFHERFHNGGEAVRASMILDEVMRTTWERKRHKRQKGCPHKTTVVKIQKGFAYKLFVFDRHGRMVECKLYVGEDAGDHFCDELLDLNDRLMEKIRNVEPMALTTADLDYLASEPDLCVICLDSLSTPKGNGAQRSVHHHDHINGSFIGLAHNYCNFITKEGMTIAAFSHNFSSYDSHIFLKELGSKKRAERLKTLSAIPLNSQKIKCLRINNIMMLDSLSFLPAPLAALTETLVLSKHKFPLLKQVEKSERKRKLLLRKGVYPYSFATSIQKLEETTQLPPRAAFANDIGDEECSLEDYAHAQKVFRTFNCQNMMDYTKLYLTTDTILLAEAVTSLRNQIHGEFGLDLCQYLSLPMLSKDLMLKMTGAKIDLMHDSEMCAMVRNNIRGGLSYVNQRYFDATKEAEKTGEPRSLVYLDANNLYGAAMSLPLPKGNFTWVDKRGREDLRKNWRTRLKLDNPIGYICEVTMTYPKKLHKKHSSFPLAPEHCTIDETHLSPYAKKALFRIDGKKRYKGRKLTSTFRKRRKYVVHGANLRFYLQQGLKLLKVHRAISFSQESFIKPYIDACTKLRAEATTKERKDLFKLLCNSLFGKWIENIMNRMNMSFVFSEKDAVYHNSHPLYKGSIICDRNFSMSIRNKSEIYMNQSWSLGFAILELSKLIMQKLFYTKIRPALHRRCTLLMTDTDSFVLACPKETSDDVVKAIAGTMDFSNYDVHHELFTEKRKAKVGYLKNEVPKDCITKFVGIRSKSYAFQTASGKGNMKKCKGVVRRYLPKLTFQDYTKCLATLTKTEVEQVSIQSKNHENRLLKSNRVAFSSFDDKRYLLCPIHSVPYGSRLIRKSKRLGNCYFCVNPNVLV